MRNHSGGGVGSASGGRVEVPAGGRLVTAPMPMLAVDTGGFELVRCLGWKRMPGDGGGYPGILEKEPAEDVEAAESVFSGTSEVGAHHGEVSGVIRRLEAAADLGVQFRHAEAAFGFVVREGDRQVTGEAGRFAVPVAQCESEIVGLAFQGVPLSAHQGRVRGEAFCDEGVIGSEVCLQFPTPEGALSALACAVGGVVHLEEQLAHLLRPTLARSMRHGGKVPDQMCTAERVGGVGVGEVHRQSVMDHDPAESGQHPRLVGSGLASGLVCEEIREKLVAGDVQPPRVAADLVAGLIDMQQRPVSQASFELLDEAAQGTGGLRCKRREEASGDTDAEHLCECLSRALDRQVLGMQQVQRHRPHIWPVARRCSRLGGEPARRHRSACTALVHDAVLGADQLRVRHVEDLANVEPLGCKAAEIVSACRAALDVVDDDFVRIQPSRQMLAGCTGLLATAPSFLPCTALFGASLGAALPCLRLLRRRVQRRRQRGALRTLPQMVLQLGDPRAQPLDLCPQRRVLCLEVLHRNVVVVPRHRHAKQSTNILLISRIPWSAARMLHHPRPHDASTT